MPFKPPKSSLTQSISAAGKIARFLFAAPADPDLKTFSNKRPMAVGLGAVGGVVTGATEFGNPSDQMSRKERRKEQLGQLGGGKKKKDKDKDKDKNRASSTEPIRNGSYTVPQVFASSPAVSQAGPARSQAISAVPSTRYTGTTAVPSMYPPLSPTAPSFLARPYSPFASEVGSRSDAATTATDVTSWPEADSQGNWATGRRPVARGDRMGRKEDFRAGSSEFGRALHMR